MYANNEAAVLQAFLAACVIPFAFDNKTAEPEYRVDPHQNLANVGQAVDLVVSKKGIRVAIEFMNSLAWNVFEITIPGGAPEKRPTASFKDVTWQDHTVWSRKIVELDDEIMWSGKVYDAQQQKYFSLQEMVGMKVDVTKAKYASLLQSPGHYGRLHAMWIVCHVGLHRVVCRQIPFVTRLRHVLKS